MLYANLLPESEKKNIALQKWLRIVEFFGIAVSVALVVGITLLAPAYLPLYFQNRELQHSLSVQREAARKIDTDRIAGASQIQAIILSLRQAAQSPGSVLDIFDLLTTERAGIVVSGFTLNKNADAVIVGRASTRGDLLAFEQRIRDSSHFQDLTSPLGNIIRETNIDFNFKATLKQQYAL